MLYGVCFVLYTLYLALCCKCWWPETFLTYLPCWLNLVFKCVEQFNDRDLYTDGGGEWPKKTPLEENIISQVNYLVRKKNHYMEELLCMSISLVLDPLLPTNRPQHRYRFQIYKQSFTFYKNCIEGAKRGTLRGRWEIFFLSPWGRQLKEASKNWFMICRDGRSSWSWVKEDCFMSLKGDKTS